MNPKLGSLRSIKFINLQLDWNKATRKKNQIIISRNERGGITIDYRDVKKIIRGYYNKFDNFHKMDKFLERQTTKAYSRRNR